MTEAEDGFRFGGLLNFLFVVLLSGAKVCAPDPIARATALLSYILTQPADGDVCHRATASADKKWGPTSSAGFTSSARK